MLESLKKTDPTLYDIIVRETARQEHGLELIASENFVSEAVMEAVGSPLTNKYAEGLPGKRYYGGCEVVDQAETLAIDRLKQLFGCEAANVQPHSGASANLAVFFAAMAPGDTFVAMSLNDGGHLTHGSPVNFSGRIYNAIPYGVDPDTHLINYDEVYKLLKEHKPKMLIAGASAYPRIIDFARLGEMAREVGARFMTDIAHIAGLVAAGLHPSPVPHADFVTTTTHKTLRGPRGGVIMMRNADAKVINSRVFPGSQGGPLMHVIAGKAVAFHEALQPDFKVYQQQVIDNAKALGEALMGKGYKLVSGGTENHLVLFDAKGSKGLTGKQAEDVLGRVEITVNKNMIPQDTESPFVTSGIRLGTPALTTRGLKEDDMRTVADLIDRSLSAPDDQSVLDSVKKAVQELSAGYPLYPHRAQ